MLELLAAAAALALVAHLVELSKSRNGARQVRPSEKPCLVVTGAESEDQLKALSRAWPALSKAYNLPQTPPASMAVLDYKQARMRSQLSWRYKGLLRRSCKLGHLRGLDVTAYLCNQLELKKDQSLYVIWYDCCAEPFVFIAESYMAADRAPN